MTDEPKTDETRTVPPQVIELEAEEVKAEEAVQAATSPPPHMPPPQRKARGNWRWVTGALVLGLLAGGWIYRGYLSAYLPTDAMTAMQARIDVLEANGKTFGEQLLAVSQASDSASRSSATLDTAVKAVESGISDVQTRISAFDSRIAEAEKTLQSARSDLATLRTAVSSGSSGGGTVDSAALAAIGQRIDTLEKDVASLKSGSGGGDAAGLTAALSQSLSDLRAKVAAGQPFPGELERIARMVPAAAGLDVLAANAAQGLPNPQGLAAELRAAIPALPQPEAPGATADDSYWDSLWSGLSGIITIRDIGEANWPQLAEKCAAIAESGDLPQALSLIEGAEGTKPAAISQWQERAGARLRLEAAVDQVAEAVLRQISALGSAP